MQKELLSCWQLYVCLAGQCESVYCICFIHGFWSDFLLDWDPFALYLKQDDSGNLAEEHSQRVSGHMVFLVLIVHFCSTLLFLQENIIPAHHGGRWEGSCGHRHKVNQNRPMTPPRHQGLGCNIIPNDILFYHFAFLWGSWRPHFFVAFFLTACWFQNVVDQMNVSNFAF